MPKFFDFVGWKIVAYICAYFLVISIPMLSERYAGDEEFHIIKNVETYIVPFCYKGEIKYKNLYRINITVL